MKLLHWVNPVGPPFGLVSVKDRPVGPSAPEKLHLRGAPKAPQVTLGPYTAKS